MASISGLDKLSYAELVQARARIDQLMIEKQNSEKDELRRKMAEMAQEHGLSIQELFGKGRKGKGGTVAPKYRDPKNPENTWTGRGRMPRWLVAATKGKKATREDFLIK